MAVDTNQDAIRELLSRSVADILPSRELLEEALLSGRRLRIYIGTDATGTSLHLGHATNYMILERFRRLGHEVIFLIGDFTSRIGDPTDKGESARKQLSREEVVTNVQTWISQVRPIIALDDPKNPVQVKYNHEWLSALGLEDILHLSAQFTVQQMIERDMFQVRMEAGKPLYLHELLYPVLQGYDSVAMEVDVEVCGTDQTFNALAGRTLLKKLKQREKFVFVTTLLENPTTGKKMMSKSEGTGVFLDFDAGTMYGAVMAQPDENMHQLFTDCTWLPLSEIDDILAHTEPRDAKMRLAREITTLFHGVSTAEKAEQDFIDTFQKKQIPEDLLTVAAPHYIEELIRKEIVASKAELRRLLAAGGIRNAETGEKITTIPETVSVPLVLKIGKRRFVKLVPE